MNLAQHILACALLTEFPKVGNPLERKEVRCHAAQKKMARIHSPEQYKALTNP